MLNRLKHALLVIKTFLPEQLPQSESGVIQFAKATCLAAGLPCNDSFIHAVASQILHLPADRKFGMWVTKRIFITALRRSIANQSSYNIITIIKEKAANEKKEADAAKSAIQSAAAN
jgi:hypothetical protein